MLFSRGIERYALIALIGALLYPGRPAVSATSGTRIAGTVVDQSGGLAISKATVTLFRNDAEVGKAATDGNGRYVFADEPPGAYYVQISAQGFGTSRSETVYLVPGENSLSLSSVIARSQVSASNLHEIGRVSVSGKQSLQTTTVIHNDFDGQLLQNENFARVGDALGALPGVNLSATSSSVGDDLFINIRGIGVTESATLLDGHPVGPVGVAPGTFFNGVPTAFDYQDTPSYALGNVQTVYGSGALGLYGTDAIGGVVDLQTINPTRANELLVKQGIGNYGKAITSLQATGSVGSNGRLGYALVHAVQGTYGNFAPQQIAQRGLLGTNLDPATLQSYTVSGNYLLRNDLLKLRYNFSPATALTLTGYSGVSWDDKSGNGDNDFQTYDQVLYNAQKTVAGGGSTLSYTDPAGKAQTYSCMPGTPGINGNPTKAAIAVQNGATSFACLAPAQFASAASGPAGGGPSPYQAIRNQDYHLRLTTAVGRHSLVLDGYADNYALDYNRNTAGGPCSANSVCSPLFPNASFLTGGFDSSFTRTNGILVSDDITGANNDFGFGYFGLHQNLSGDTYNTGTFVLNPNQGFNFQESNYFVRDVYTPTSQFSAFFNAWVKHTTISNETKLDPRLSLVFKPTGRDVIRLTAGSSTEAPTPSLRLGTSSLNQTPQNINPNCHGQLTSVGQIGNPAVSSETGSGQEFAYGHNFGNDTTLQVDVYNENVFGKIFLITEPVSTFGANLIPPYLLTAYVNRLKSFCSQYSGDTTAQILQLLSVDTPTNAAQGRYRGIEISGRYRFNPFLYMDYAYDTQSAVLRGIPDSVLMANTTLIPGAQVLSIPLHKYSAGIDVTDRKGFEARVDTYFIGDNNSYNRPGYYYSNAYVAKTFAKSTTLTLGFYNLFDSASDQYGRIGLGVFQAQNQFGTASNAFDQQSERFGLPPTQITFSVTQKI